MPLPRFQFCGCCHYYHPEGYYGECRDDEKRFCQEDLDHVYGVNMWEDVEETEYVNKYQCTSCGEEWEDTWTCMVDDECPKCGTIMTPYGSEENV